MRNILDTNILVRALIVPGGAADYLFQCWRAGRFVLISSEEQLEEFQRVTRYPRLQKYIRPAAAGAMLNEIRALITGDGRHLLTIGRYRRTHIISVREGRDLFGAA